MTTPGPAQQAEKFDYAIHLGDVLLKDDFAGAPLCATGDEDVVRGAIRTVLDLAIASARATWEAEQRERVEEAAKAIDQQQVRHEPIGRVGIRTLKLHEITAIITAAFTKE